MFKVLCYDNGKTTYVIDCGWNDYNQPTCLYRSPDRDLAMVVCESVADDMEIILGENGFLSEKVQVPDTEPLYVIKGDNGCFDWTKKSPITYNVLLGLFYGQTDVCGGNFKHMWMREYLREVVAGERKERKSGVINFLEAYWNVRIEKVN